MGKKDEGQIILYQTDDGKVTVDVRFEDETFWVTQKAMGELFNVESHTVTYHLQEIFKTAELEEAATTRKLRVVRKEGNRNVEREIQYYNLDAIIAVGYRVNSKQATRFRQWATQTLKAYIQKGFVLNDEMLKNGRPFGKDYFDELLERIREIRASERRAYQKIADIFEQCSYDYDKSSQTTREFYSFVQNKLHFAITGKTAAELIAERVTLDHPTMGLTTWKAAPDGKIIKSDVVVAKNYLNENELSRLNRIVTMFIDHAELMAEDEVLMSMADWLKETDNFLTGLRRKVLDGKGRVSHDDAVKKAEEVYAQFRVKQDEAYISEFDRDMAKYLRRESNANLGCRRRAASERTYVEKITRQPLQCGRLPAGRRGADLLAVRGLRRADS
jgi:hypothetical protein